MKGNKLKSVWMIISYLNFEISEFHENSHFERQN